MSNVFDELVTLRAQLEAVTRERDGYREALEMANAAAKTNAEERDMVLTERNERQKALEVALEEQTSALTERNWANERHDEARADAARLREALEALVEYERKRHPPKMGGDEFPPSLREIMYIARAALASTPSAEPPRLASQEVADALKTGQLEAAANVEYRSGKYDPEKGGPALKALNEHRGQVAHRRFPVLDAGFSIPWEYVAPFEQQAQRNHDQSLARLAERGGLSPLELWCVMHGKKWRERGDMNEERAKVWALSLLDTELLTHTIAMTLAAVRAKIHGTAALPEHSRGIRHCFALISTLDPVVLAKKLKGTE